MSVVCVVQERAICQDQKEKITERKADEAGATKNATAINDNLPITVFTNWLFN
jgi:hypothetical protein